MTHTTQFAQCLLTLSSSLSEFNINFNSICGCLFPNLLNFFSWHCMHEHKVIHLHFFFLICFENLIKGVCQIARKPIPASVFSSSIKPRNTSSTNKLDTHCYLLMCYHILYLQFFFTRASALVALMVVTPLVQK